MPSRNSICLEDDNFVNLHPKKKFFKICKCEKEFNAKRLYYSHRKECPIAKTEMQSRNFISLENDSVVNLHPKKEFFKHCKCEKEFNAKSSYYKHLKKCHVAKGETPSENNFTNLPPKKNIFKICKCEKEFNAKSSYYAHQKKCPVAKSEKMKDAERMLLEVGKLSENDNFNNLSPKKKFFRICKCEKEFNAERSYYSHLKVCPLGMRLGNYICLEEDCSFRAVLSDDFLRHLKDIHNRKLVEDVKIFQNYSDFKSWFQNFEKEERSSFIRHNANSSGSKRVEYYYCNRSGKYLSRSTGKRCPKSQGSRKIGFSCPATIRAIVETESSLVTVNIKSLHYGHSLDLCHINLPKDEKNEIANQLLQGVQPKEVLKNICDISSTKLERKNLCTKQDLKNIKRSYGIKNVKNKKLKIKDADHPLSVDLYVEEVITACMPVNDVEVKDELMLKISQIQELIETCNNQDLLLASRQHINNALSILNISQLETETAVKNLSLELPNIN